MSFNLLPSLNAKKPTTIMLRHRQVLIEKYNKMTQQV